MKTEQIEKFHQALLSAFPSRDEFELLLFFGLKWPLNEIAGNGPLREVVFQVLKYADAHNQLTELLNAAYKRNPGNLRLKEFYWDVNGAPPGGDRAGEVKTPPETTTGPRPYPLVFCHAPGDSRFAALLEKHLIGLVQAGLIERPWSEAMIPPGANTKATIQRHWNAAEIILLLVSADFLASGGDYLSMAQARRAQGATVIPIIVRPALWNISWVGSLQAWPRDSEGKVKPVSSWSQVDDAMFNAIEGLQVAIAARRAGQEAS